VGRRTLATMVSEYTAREMVAPDMCEQKRSREGATDATGVVSEVEVPQRLNGDIRNIDPVPTSPDFHCRPFVGMCHRRYFGTLSPMRRSV
jgi:hypothetical protein